MMAWGFSVWILIVFILRLLLFSSHFIDHVEIIHPKNNSLVYASTYLDLSITSNWDTNEFVSVYHELRISLYIDNSNLPEYVYDLYKPIKIKFKGVAKKHSLKVS